MKKGTGTIRTMETSGRKMERQPKVISIKKKVLYMPAGASRNGTNRKYLTVKITKNKHQFYEDEKMLLNSPKFIEGLRSKGMTIQEIRTTMRHTGPHQWDYETLPGPHAVGKPRRISMIRVKALILRSDKWLWEIYAYEDKRLFSDTRRFDKPRAEVEKIVFDYLRGKDMGEQIEGFDEDDSWTKI